MYKYNYNIIRIHVNIPYHIVDCYTNTIGGMQNGMDFFYHCKKFEYIHDFEQSFWNIVDALLEFGVLGSNV